MQLESKEHKDMCTGPTFRGSGYYDNRNPHPKAVLQETCTFIPGSKGASLNNEKSAIETQYWKGELLKTDLCLLPCTITSPG